MTDILLQIGADFPGADKVNEQLNKLDRSLDDNIKAVNKFDQEFRRLERAKKKETVTTQGYNAALQQSVSRLLETGNATDRQTQAMERNTATMQRGQRVTMQTGSAQQALRQRFLETANSVAILDGPLGGVASRFSAFGILVGRTGVILAGFLTTFAALGFALRRGVSEAIEYETSMARISAVLDTVGRSSGITANQVSALSESIALGSLQSASAVRDAAQQVLTFGNVSNEVFPEVLKLASDMAALGFGSMQSEAVKLAKAIEDPTQSLTSLSRSGITFTRDQRRVILSLSQTGQQAEATARILEVVRNQVGGAAAREAETFAGAVDTLRQAFGLLSRTAGQFVLEQTKIDDAVRKLAGRFEEFMALNQQFTTPAGIEFLERAIESYEAKLENLIEKQEKLFDQEAEGNLQTFLELERQIDYVSDTLARLQKQLGDGTSDVVDGIDRTVENLNDALAKLDISLDDLTFDAGLTSMEAFVESTLRAAGVFGKVEEHAKGLVEELTKAAQIDFVVKQAAALENNLRRATDAFHDSNAAAQAQLEFIGQTGREAQVLRSIREQQLRVEAEILRLEEQKKDASEEQVGLIEKQQQGLRDQLQSYEQAAEGARQVAAASDQIEVAQRAAADEATRFSSVINGSQSVIDAAKSRVEGLTAEVEALANGADRYAANIARGLALQRAANREAVASIEDPAQRIAATAELAIKQAELNDILQREAELLRSRDEILTGGRTSGGGGGSGAERRLEQLQQEIEAMQMRLDLSRDFMAEEILQQEVFFEEQRNLLDEALQARIISYEEHYKLQELLKEEHEGRMADIARQSRMAEIGGFSDFMGSMASIAQQGGSNLERISRVFAAAQALSKAFQMAVGAGADTPGPIWVRLAAYASALSTGLGAVSAIRGGRSSSGASPARSVASARPAANVAVPTTTANQNQAPQRVLIQGLDPNALFTGEQIQNLFEAFYNENDNRGKVFVVQQ